MKEKYSAMFKLQVLAICFSYIRIQITKLSPNQKALILGDVVYNDTLTWTV